MKEKCKEMELIMRETKIIRNLEKLRESLFGCQDCTILISKKCSHDIDKMPYDDYKILKQEIKSRNINLEVGD